MNVEVVARSAIAHAKKSFVTITHKQSSEMRNVLLQHKKITCIIFASQVTHYLFAVQLQISKVYKTQEVSSYVKCKGSKKLTIHSSLHGYPLNICLGVNVSVSYHWHPHALLHLS